MKDIIKYGFILGVICFLASSVLAVVNGITAPQILLQKGKIEKEALKEVLPEAVVFKPNIEGEKIVYFTAYDSAGKLKGFVVTAVSRGYSSDVEVMAGLDMNLEITQAKILAQNETPGLGNRILEPKFLKLFKAKNAQSLQKVEVITGATISSRAVINSLKNKINEMQEKLRKEISNAG